MEQPTKKQRHWHKGERVFAQASTSCVGMSCNPDAHDGDTFIERCVCGGYRYINNNRGCNEYGTWIVDNLDLCRT